MAKRDYNRGGQTVGETFLVSEQVTALAGAANINLPGFSKNASVRFEVLDFWWIQTAVGPAAASTVQLRKGDGAASEAFSVISNALAIGTAADETITRAGTLNDANREVEANGSLNIVAVASAGTHSGLACVLCRVKAAN